MDIIWKLATIIICICAWVEVYRTIKRSEEVKSNILEIERTHQMRLKEMRDNHLTLNRH